MTQVFGEDGNHIPVTVIQAGPCTVVGIRTQASHGYDALQLGFEPRKKNVTKPMAGHFKKAGVGGGARRARDPAGEGRDAAGLSGGANGRRRAVQAW